MRGFPPVSPQRAGEGPTSAAAPGRPQERTAGRRRLADAVLELVWRHKTISRAEISRLTGRSRSTISDMVADLLQTDLVREAGSGRSRGGRRPVILEFRDHAHVILGVDMGATHVSAALTDLRGRVLAWHDRIHDVRGDPEGSVALLSELCEACLASRPASAGELLGIGFGLPSPVDPASPDRISPRVFPAWRGQRVFGGLGERFGVPVYAENDANLGAVAEQWWGKAAGSDNFMYVKVGTGVGAGIVLNGEVFRGATGVAGELGHIVVDGSGPPCVCGSRGCLATFVGTRALVARAKSLLRRHPDSILAAAEPDIVAIEDAALAGDPLAVAVTDEAAHYLGTALAGIMNLMNLGSIVVGGSLARLGERLLAPLREAVLSRTLVGSAACTIDASSLGPRSVALGAATHVLVAALADPRLFPGVESR